MPLNPGDPELKPVVGRAEKLGEDVTEWEPEEDTVGTLTPVVARAVGEIVEDGDWVASPVVGREENDVERMVVEDTEGLPDPDTMPVVGIDEPDNVKPLDDEGDPEADTEVLGEVEMVKTRTSQDPEGELKGEGEDVGCKLPDAEVELEAVALSLA